MECFFSVSKWVKVFLRESLSYQHFCAHSLRFLAKSEVPSWLRWRPYLCRWIFLMFGCLISKESFVSSNLMKSTLFSFALCLSTLIVGAERIILTDGNIFQIKLFDLPNSSSISSALMCYASFVQTWRIILSGLLRSNGTR